MLAEVNVENDSKFITQILAKKYGQDNRYKVLWYVTIVGLFTNIVALAIIVIKFGH